MIRPTVLRRPVMITVWIALALACAVLSPLLLVIAGLASLITRRRQPLLMLQFGLSYLLREMAVIVACGWLWLSSGCGWRLGSERFQHAHYRLLCWLLDGLLSEVLRSLSLEIDANPSTPAERALSDRRPLLLFSRHAGPGDSFIIVHLLLSRFGRRPRIVMKETLAVDPCIDLLCHRLPNALIDPSQREECAAEISQLAAGLADDGVVVLFPEGANFTADRRRRAIFGLWRQGRGEEATRAEQLVHVLPPKPAGALAALAGNPGADVVFAAHTGLGRQAFATDMWRELPRQRTLHMRMWLAPAADRPQDPEGQADWLYGWWQHLDAWIHAQGLEEPPPQAPSVAPR